MQSMQSKPAPKTAGQSTKPCSQELKTKPQAPNQSPTPKFDSLEIKIERRRRIK